MAYSTDLLDKRVEIWNREEGAQTALGKQSGRYVCKGVAWAGLTWNKGVKAMREGALDAYDIVMVRMRWNPLVNRDTRIVCEGKTYEVDSLNSDKGQDVMQMTCHEIQE